MNFYTHLKDISHSENLGLQMQAWAEEAFNLKANKNLKINVYMKKTVSKGQLANKQFECHIMAEAPWLQKNIFVKHKDEDFWSAYTQSSKKLSLRMQKEKKRFERSKIRQLKTGQGAVWKIADNTNSEMY